MRAQCVRPEKELDAARRILKIGEGHPPLSSQRHDAPGQANGLPMQFFKRVANLLRAVCPGVAAAERVDPGGPPSAEFGSARF